MQRFRDRRCDFISEGFGGAGWRLKGKSLELGRNMASFACLVMLQASGASDHAIVLRTGRLAPGVSDGE